MMSDRETRIELLKGLLAERVLLLDGATGTALQACHLHAEDFGDTEVLLPK